MPKSIVPLSPKRPRLSNESPPSTPNQQQPQDSQQNKELDSDNLQFELDLAPELEILTQSIDDLSLEGKKGDELQEKAISLALQGNNIFLTGKAGTGKSWTVSRIVQKLKSQNKTIYVTAPSGIAAINVNGCTINTYGGFHLGEYYEDFDKMMSKVNREKIKRTDVLLIDEISMLNGELFDILEYMVTYIRCYDEMKDLHKVIQSKTNSDCIGSLSALKMRWMAEEHGGFAHLPPWGGYAAYASW